jgi:hypothetical protein
MAKLWHVKPAVDKILNTDNVEQQAVVLHTVANHSAPAAACELARINLRKEQATTKYVCEQSVQMLEHAHSSKNVHGKAMRDKHHAAKVVLLFTAPSPNRVSVVSSQRKCACLIEIASSTLDFVNNRMIKKREQLTAGERRIYWAIAKGKKGYSKISNKLKLLLLNSFNNHPHIAVAPNTKDTLQVMNADGKKSLVRNNLTMVRLGIISLDIVQDNPTIKNKVG